MTDAPITWDTLREGEGMGDAHAGDVAGHIVIVFTNAISARGGKRRVRPDLHSARVLAAHFRPYNNTRIEAWVITRTDGRRTASKPVDLRIGGRFVFCSCFRDDETECPRVDALAAELRG